MKFLKLTAATLLLGSLLAHANEASADTVLITGANGGIGLEFAKEYAEKSWTVIATHHRSETPPELAELAAKYRNLRVEKLDVSSKDDIDGLAAKLKDTPIDVLINNAGVYSKSGAPNAQTFGQLDYGLFDQIMAVNVRGPLMILEAFLGNVKASHQKKVVNISSTVGSLVQPYPGGGAVFYRTSKAALNKEMQVMAELLKPQEVTVVMIHPGLVRTERLMTMAPSVKENKNYMNPDEVVPQMIKTIEKVSIKDTGHFMNFDKKPLPW